MNRSRIFFIVFTLIFTGSLTVRFSSAQVSPSTATLDTQQVLIQKLQQLIASLQIQINELKSKLEITQQDLAVVKSEIQFTQFLSQGSEGDEVKQLQEVLSKDPDIYPEGKITGFFGPATESAVKRFQEKNGIDALGIIGPKTRSQLNKLITKGAGRSEVIPWGLLKAPGLERNEIISSSSSPLLAPLLATTSPVIVDQPGAGISTTTIPAVPAQFATSTASISAPTPSAGGGATPSSLPSPTPTPTPVPSPSPMPAPVPSPAPSPTPSSGATSTPPASSTNSNNNSLLSFTRVNSDRYVLSFSDPDGLQDINIRKAGGSVLYSGRPLNCPTQLEGSSGGWLNFKFFPSDFPLTGSIIDCAHSGVAYPVQASLPPLPGPSPVSAQNSQVQGVTATVSADRAVLVSWTPVPIGVSVYGIYNIYRGASADFIPNAQANLIARVNNTVYQDAQVPDGVYYYKVALQDINGVVGLASVAVQAVVGIHAVFPSVDGLSASVSGTSVTLSWQGHADYPTLPANNNSINIYRGTTSNFTPSPLISNPTNLIVQGNVLSYRDGNLQPGTYYYKAAWQDINGVVGPYSAAVSAIVSSSTTTARSAGSTGFAALNASLYALADLLSALRGLLRP